MTEPPSPTNEAQSPAGPGAAPAWSPERIEVVKTRDTRARIEEFRKRHRTSLLTLVFTDVVGSTLLKQRRGDSAATAILQAHAALVRDILAHTPDAQEISTAGDSFFCVFVRPSDAISFALRLQAAMRHEFGRSAIEAPSPQPSPKG
ncbi:MAG: adenylate/guanylate cyclase domain-containing protein, partial [Planctomycetota bacterium]|nr:adenylate/guanylate cyclase domain-containing protein [Planctomycetota bacterium]